MCNGKCSCKNQSKDVENVDIYIEKVTPDAIIPKYMNQNDSGMDICANETIVVNEGETVIVKTGIKLLIPKGYEIQIRQRSGLSANTPLRLANCVATIDSNFLYEIGVILSNTSPISENNIVYDLSSKGNKKGHYMIKKGERIAQIILARSPRIVFHECASVEALSEYDRGKGLGSTGVEGIGEVKKMNE